MIRLLMLNYEFPPLGGGAANANYYLLREFAEREELTVDLVTSSVDHYRLESFAERIRVHYLDIGKRGNLHYQTMKDLLSYSARARGYCRKLCKLSDFDLIHAFFGIPCGYLAQKLSLPYIVSLRGSDVPFYNKRFYYLDKFLFKRMSRVVWQGASSVVANSNGLRQLAHETSPEQSIEIIFNGVDTELFCPPPSKPVCKELTIVSTGRLIARKGYRYLLEAMDGLEAMKLVLVGDGDVRDELEQFAGERRIDVRFTGRKEKEDVVQLLQEADVFVLPSLNEGMSNSLLEAMACGLPAIVTDVGGSGDLVNDNGFIVAKESASELTEALLQYRDNRELLKQHGKKSRELALAMSWSAMAAQYLEIYSRIKSG